MTAAGIDGSRRRPRSNSHRRSARTAFAAVSSITTGSRTTLATRWPSLGPRSAAGAVAVTRVRATGLRTDPRSGVLSGLLATDLLTGTELEIQTKSVVDATGVWAAEADHPFASPSMTILPSRGAHLVVPRERIPNQMGLTIRVPGKIVFLVPWPDHWLIGTTDAPFEGPAERPAAGRLGDPAPHRHGERHDGREPDPGRCRRHVRRAAAAHRALGRVDGQGLARASRDGRPKRCRPDRRRQVHDVPGHGERRHRCRPRAGRDEGPTQPDGGLAAHRCRRCPFAGSDRGRTHDDPGDGRPRTGGRGAAGRPARDGGAGRGRARCGPRVASAARRRPGLPRSRDRVGRPPRVRALDR